MKRTSEIVQALGGIPAVAALTGCTRQTVWAWRAYNVFPSKTFVVLRAALARLQIDTPISLWGMIEPANSQEEATKVA